MYITSVIFGYESFVLDINSVMLKFMAYHHSNTISNHTTHTHATQLESKRDQLHHARVALD
jgi:hypothetical protein